MLDWIKVSAVFPAHETLPLAAFNQSLANDRWISHQKSVSIGGLPSRRGTQLNGNRRSAGTRAAPKAIRSPLAGEPN